MINDSGTSGSISLKNNLNSAGIRNLDSMKYEILHYSPDDEEKNQEAYYIINQRLYEIIHNSDTGEYIHITGEMKAFADSNHRKCINELYLQNGQCFKILFSLPSKKYKMNGYFIKRYNKEKWKRGDWLDHIEAFDMLGEAKANLFNKYERERIQYSLFGNDLILFQSIHTPTDYSKEVWIIESRSLFQKLFKRALLKFKKALYIQPIEFNRFNLSLASIQSLDVLFSLMDNGGLLKKKIILKKLKEFNGESNNIFENLLIMDLIQEVDDNNIKILEDGQEYLKLFL